VSALRYPRMDTVETAEIVCIYPFSPIFHQIERMFDSDSLVYSSML